MKKLLLLTLVATGTVLFNTGCVVNDDDDDDRAVSRTVTTESHSVRAY